MNSIFVLLSSNGETLILSFQQWVSGQQYKTLAHQDLKERNIKSAIKDDFNFLLKHFVCDSEYLRFHINDLISFCQYVEVHNQIKLYYKNHKTQQLIPAQYLHIVKEHLHVMFSNHMLHFVLPKAMIPYDLDMLTYVKPNYILCREQSILIYFMDKVNQPLYHLLTNYKTPHATETELKEEIRNKKIKNISFVNLLTKEEFVKKLRVKQSTFKTFATIVFSWKPKQAIEWFDTDGHLAIAIDDASSIYRDRNLENQCIQEIKDVGFYKAGDGWHLLKSNVEEILLQLQSQGWVIQQDEKESVKEFVYHSIRLELSVTFREDWFDIDVECKVDQEDLSLDFLFKKAEKGEKQIQLSNNRYAVLDDVLIQKLRYLRSFYKSNENKFKLPLFMAQQLDSSNSNVFIVRKDQKTEDFFQSLKDFKHIEKIKPPKELKISLRDYQREGLDWLAFLNRYHLGGILADDMGLGKTAQVIALLLHKKKLKGRTINCIIAPKSLLFNWEAEVQKFTDDLTVVKYYGSNRLESLKVKDFDILLTTYGTIRNDYEFLSHFNFDGIFLDESQSIKNFQSKSFQGVLQLNGRLKICMTGTPIENHVGELWSQLQFAMPALVDSHDSFIRQFIKSPTDVGLQEFKKIIFPFILRRKKEDVAKELPSKVEQTLSCAMTPNQHAIYENIRASVRNQLLAKVDTDGLSRSTLHILEALLRLRQAACHTSLVSSSGETAESGKLQNLISMVEEVYGDNHKILIFSQFIQMLSIIKKELEARNIPYHYLDGKTNNRGAIVNDFQNTKEAGVFLISLKAGGVGLNLTAADYVFIFDPWWNPAVEMQAIDRTHRIGQNKTVFAYRLISQGSVEEKIMQLKERKKNIADLVITAEKSLLRELTREDLEFLFS